MASRKRPRLARSLRRGDLPRSPADIWLAGLGALGASDRRGRGRFDALVAEGRRVKAEGGAAVQDALARLEGVAVRAAALTTPPAPDADVVEDVIGWALRTASLPSVDLADLRSGLHRLHVGLAALAGEDAPEASLTVEVSGAGWEVRIEGRSGPASVHTTKKGALGAGRSLARSLAPSRLVVHRTDGSAGETLTYDA